MRPTRRTQRLIACGLLIGLGVLPFLSVLAAGVYLRSPFTHRAMEQHLSEFFGLPTRVGQVIVLGRHEWELHDVEIFLPNGQERFNPALRVAHCRKAVWVKSSKPGMYDLVLYDGTLDLSPAQWAKGDFKLLEKSLRHDWPALSLNRIGLYRVSVRWGKGDFPLQLDNTDGVIWFDQIDGKTFGRARLTTTQLNGKPVSLAVDATFNPLKESVANGGNGLVRQFTLTTNPRQAAPIPLAQLRLDKLVGRPIASGSFLGTLHYQATPGADGQPRHVFAIRDAELLGVKLDEFTTLTGQVDVKARNVEIEEVTMPGQEQPQWRVARMQFSGSLRQFDLAAAMKLLGQPNCPGVLDVDVQAADIEPGKPIHRLELSGKAGKLDLAELTGLLKEKFNDGRIRGQAQVDKLKLTIKEGVLESGEVELTGVEGIAGVAAPVIEFKFIKAALPAMGALEVLKPPERIDYRKLKLRGASDGKRGLILTGLGGDDDKSLMTMMVPTPRLLQRIGMPEIALLNVPGPGDARPIDIGPLVDFMATPVPQMMLTDVKRTVERTIRPLRGNAE